MFYLGEIQPSGAPENILHGSTHNPLKVVRVDAVGSLVGSEILTDEIFSGTLPDPELFDVSEIIIRDEFGGLLGFGSGWAVGVGGLNSGTFTPPLTGASLPSGFFITFKNIRSKVVLTGNIYVDNSPTPQAANYARAFNDMSEAWFELAEAFKPKTKPTLLTTTQSSDFRGCVRAYFGDGSWDMTDSQLNGMVTPYGLPNQILINLAQRRKKSLSDAFAQGVWQNGTGDKQRAYESWLGDYYADNIASLAPFPKDDTGQYWYKDTLNPLYFVNTFPAGGRSIVVVYRTADGTLDGLDMQAIPLNVDFGATFGLWFQYNGSANSAYVEIFMGDDLLLTPMLQMRTLEIRCAAVNKAQQEMLVWRDADSPSYRWAVFTHKATDGSDTVSGDALQTYPTPANGLAHPTRRSSTGWVTVEYPRAIYGDSYAFKTLRESNEVYRITDFDTVPYQFERVNIRDIGDMWGERGADKRDVLPVSVTFDHYLIHR